MALARPRVAPIIAEARPADDRIVIESIGMNHGGPMQFGKHCFSAQARQSSQWSRSSDTKFEGRITP